MHGFSINNGNLYTVQCIRLALIMVMQLNLAVEASLKKASRALFALLNCTALYCTVQLYQGINFRSKHAVNGRDFLLLKI